MPKFRLVAFLGLLAIFVSGVVCGALVFSTLVYRQSMASAASRGSSPPVAEFHKGPGGMDPEQVRKKLIEEMRQRVKLDDAQVAQLNWIYDETRAQFDEINKEMNERGRALWDKQVAAVKAILRPDQQPLYDQLRAEHEAARKRRHEQQGDKK